MKNLKIMVIGSGLLAMSTVETLAEKLPDYEIVFVEQIESEVEKLTPELFQIEEFQLTQLDGLMVDFIHVESRISFFEIHLNAGWEIPSLELITDALSLKVPIYSVPLPDENKIVLVKDPKGFVERAIRHKMEFIAIKPAEKGEFWELVPVFSVEQSLSFNPKKTVEEAPDEEMELLRIVPVADFLRYN